VGWCVNTAKPQCDKELFLMFSHSRPSALQTCSKRLEPTTEPSSTTRNGKVAVHQASIDPVGCCRGKHQLNAKLQSSEARISDPICSEIVPQTLVYMRQLHLEKRYPLFHPSRTERQSLKRKRSAKSYPGFRILEYRDQADVYAVLAREARTLLTVYPADTRASDPSVFFLKDCMVNQHSLPHSMTRNG
jgi:hypothetical protein